MSKGELINLAKSRGIKVTAKDTVASLMDKIRENHFENPPIELVNIVKRRKYRVYKALKNGKYRKLNFPTWGIVVKYISMA